MLNDIKEIYFKVHEFVLAQSYAAGKRHSCDFNIVEEIFVFKHNKTVFAVNGAKLRFSFSAEQGLVKRFDFFHQKT